MEVGYQTSCSERALDKSWIKQDEEMGMSGLGTVQSDAPIVESPFHITVLICYQL